MPWSPAGNLDGGQFIPKGGGTAIAKTIDSILNDAVNLLPSETATAGESKKDASTNNQRGRSGFIRKLVKAHLDGQYGVDIGDLIEGLFGKNQVKLLTGVPYDPRTVLGDGFTYGNYGGGHWGGGKILKDGQEPPDAPPVDSMDEIFMYHGYDYGDAEKESDLTKRERMIYEADKTLVKRLKALHSNPGKWQRIPSNISAAKSYRVAAIIFFGDQAGEYEKKHNMR